MNFAELDKLLGSRAKRNMPHAKATVMRREGDEIVVRYHETDVARLRANGDVVLNSGGWMTSTTKGRLNEFVAGAFNIWADKGLWTVHPKTGRRASVPFADGMTVNVKTGKVKGEMKPKALADLMVRRKKVSRFCKEFIAKLQRGEIPKPSGGDCWICMAISEEAVQVDDYHGATERHAVPGNGGGHLWEHVTDSYYVPTLLMNVGNAMLSPYHRNYLVAVLFGESAGQGAGEVAARLRRETGDYFWRQAEKALRKFMFRQLRLGETR